MLEAGMSLIAVNLPSLWFLFSKGVLESSLRSIRSVLSLRTSTSTSSKRSYKTGRASQTTPSGAAKDSFSGSSSHLTRDADGDTYESFAMHNKTAFDLEQGAGSRSQVGELSRHREEAYPH